MQEYYQFVIAGAAVTAVLTFLIRFGWSKPRPLRDGELPSSLSVKRDGGALKIRHRWGGGWDLVTLLLYAVVVVFLAPDMASEPVPPTIGEELAFLLIGLPIGYGLLVKVCNRSLFTVTAEQIAAKTRPFPVLQPPVRFDIADCAKIVCERVSVYGTYKLAVRDKAGSSKTICDDYWTPHIPLAVARLIAGALPTVALEIDLDTPAMRRARRKAGGR